MMRATLRAGALALALFASASPTLAQVTAPPGESVSGTVTAAAATGTASGTITANDTGTTTTAGQSGVNLVTGTPTANSSLTFPTLGYSSVTVTAQTATSFPTGASFQIETSSDGGVTYFPASGKIGGTSITSSAITGYGVFRVDTTGMDHLRVRATAYTSGTLTLAVQGSNSSGLTQVLNPVRLVDANGNAAVFTSGGAFTGQITVADGGDTTFGSKADAATCATTNTFMACARQLHTDLQSILTGVNSGYYVAGTGQTFTGGSAIVGPDSATSTTADWLTFYHADGGAEVHVMNTVAVTVGNTVPVTVSGQADPCFASAKLTADFESTTSGGSIITAVSGKKAYICGIRIHASAAANISLNEGTGSSVCTGGTISGDYLNTGSTAANGAAYAANSGDSVGFANATVAQNATAGQNTCVLFTTSGTPQVNVHVSYVQQ
jgi:hypothetical protein